MSLREMSMSDAPVSGDCAALAHGSDPGFVILAHRLLLEMLAVYLGISDKS